MSNVMVLPAIDVKAVRDAFSPPLGLTSPMPSPAHIIISQHQMRMKMYGEGYWREMFVKHMEEANRALENGWKLVPTAGFLFDTQKIPVADKYMCINPNALSSEAVREAVNGWGYGKSIADVREISGGVLSPMAALGHYFHGGGADVVTNINTLGLNITASKVPALEAVFASAMVGSTSVDLAKVPYNTAESSWVTAAWLGTITLKIDGVVHKQPDGTFYFSGSARAYNDIYDFNASMHRSELGEASTKAGLLLGEVMSGMPYQIAIQGELPISIQR